ncbi:MAG: DUF1365 domain-containing protein [Akkermansiaceae bacterium]
MNSALYQCRIFHKRLKPVTRKFSYSVFMMSLDLDELDSLAKRHWLFSRNRWNIYSIRDEDYLQLSPIIPPEQYPPPIQNQPPEQNQPPLQNPNIKQKLLDYLSDKDVNLAATSRIILQTFPRVFGYQFNPVSFYYLEDVSGNTIAVVAEVGNTFHEKKLFLINEKEKPGWFRLKTNKDFYVSPFSKVNDHFDFQIGPKDEKWSVNINDEDEDGIVLVSTIRGKRKSFSSLRLSWYIIRYPLLTLRVIFLIHWHALIMWIKKFPISNKKGTASQQLDVLRPHKSLTKK